MPDLSDPVTIRGEIKATRTNSETGERTITLSFPKSEAGRVAQLSIYDRIAFDVQFTPVDVAQKRSKKPKEARL